LAALATAHAALAGVKPELAANDVDAVRAAAKAVFGDPFQVLPLIEPGTDPATDLFASAYGEIAPGGSLLRRFVRDVGTVRDGVARYGEALLFGEALGRSRTLTVAQLAAAGTAGVSKWIGLPFDPAEQSPDAPVTSILVDAPPDLTGEEPVAGLSLDEWTE